MQVLTRLSAERDRAAEKLIARGYDPERVSRISRRSSGIYWHYHFDGPPPRELSRFVSSVVLPQVAHLPCGLSARAIEAFRQLIPKAALDNSAAWIALLNVTPHSFADWLSCLESVAPEHRYWAANLVARQRCDLLDVPSVPVKIFEWFRGMSIERFGGLFPQFLAALSAGVSPEFLEVGVELSKSYAITFDVDKGPEENDADAEALDDLTVRIFADEGDHARASSFIDRLWKATAEAPGFCPFLRTADWKNLSPDEIESFLHQFLCAAEDEDKDWSPIRERLPEYLKTYQRVPNRAKFLKDLSEYLWYFDRAEDMEFYHPRLLVLTERLASPPFSTWISCAEVIARLLRKRDAVSFERLLSLPDAVFLRLERECSSKNRRWLTARGMYALSRNDLDFTLSALTSATSSILKAAKRLGALKWTHRLQILSRFRSSDIASFQPETLDAERAAELHRVCIELNTSSPISQRLARHSRGERTLTPAQIERDLWQARGLLRTAQSNALERSIDAMLSGVFGREELNADEKHALDLLYWADANRRPLRRFLRAHLRGESHGLLENHPVNRRWIESHPAIDSSRWRSGYEMALDVDGQGRVTLGFEQDPLEILKIGTYTGTCLGVGGSWAESAASILLDENKRVIFARDERGAFLARQVVAITDDSQLVCYQPYPDKPELSTLFQEYDRALADFVGCSLYEEDDDSDESYEVSELVSESFWDDGAWDFERTEPVEKLAS